MSTIERMTKQQPLAARPSAAGAVREHPPSRGDRIAHVGVSALQQALGNAALARWRLSAPRVMLQRLKASEVVVDKTYTYTDADDAQEKTGKLVSKGGGWYRFQHTDGTTGRAYTAQNVKAEVPTPGAPPPTGGDMDVDGSQERMDDEEHEDTDDDDVELEDAPSSDAPRSFAEEIRDAGRLLGIDDHVVLSVLIELTARQLRFTAATGVLDDVLHDAKSIASCMKTAANLVSLFETGAAVAHGAATRKDGGSMRRTARDLCDEIRRLHAGGCLVNVTYGIHGFVVVVWGDHAEFLQSFAGESEPETLGANFSNPRVFTVDGVCEVLFGMAAGNKGARAEGQTAISGRSDYEAATVLEDAENTWPDVDFKWVAYTLAAPGVVLGRIVARIKGNIAVVRRAQEQQRWALAAQTARWEQIAMERDRKGK